VARAEECTGCSVKEVLARVVHDYTRSATVHIVQRVRRDRDAVEDIFNAVKQYGGHGRKGGGASVVLMALPSYTKNQQLSL